MLPDPDTYLSQVEERFATSTDFTIGLEEEFQILDPGSLALTGAFELLRDSAPGDLRASILGELLSSEIEIATPKCDTFGDAARDIVARRRALFAHAGEQGFTLGATGTHAFSSWQDQRIIDTPHYRAVEDKLKYVAWRNNTWSQHIHVGIRGIDRAIAVCDAMRAFLPYLLALSANSTCIEGVWTHLHSVRTQTFVRMFPRCGIPDIFGDWATQRRYFEGLFATDCIQEFTQVWWSVRPHYTYGTVEVRICDVQSEPWQTLAVHALALGLVATLAGMVDDGRPLPARETRFIEENLWRAIRYGLDGKLVDWDRCVEVPAPDALRALVEWVAPAGETLGLSPYPGRHPAPAHRGQRRPGPGTRARPGKSCPRCARRRGRKGQCDRRRREEVTAMSDDDEAKAGREESHEDRPPTDEERAEAYSRQLKQLHVVDLVRDMMVTLVTVGYEKLGLTDQTRELRDLDDARVAIEALRRLIEVVEAGDPEDASLRSTLAQMQLNFARVANAEMPAPPRRERAPSEAESRPPVESEQEPAKAPDQPLDDATTKAAPAKAPDGRPTAAKRGAKKPAAKAPAAKKSAPAARKSASAAKASAAKKPVARSSGKAATARKPAPSKATGQDEASGKDQS